MSTTDNTDALPPLPERDSTKPAEQQGLFRKFIVTRTDGSSEPGGKHEHCEYFVLDVNHDPHAAAALAAYAVAVEATHPELAADMRARYALTAQQGAQVPSAHRMKETLEFIATHFSSDWPERCQSHVLAARYCLSASPQTPAQPELCHRNPAPNASQPMVPTPSVTVTIGTAPAAQQRPALVTALRGLLAALNREPTEFELRAAAHEFTVLADRIAAGHSRREDGDG